MLAGERRWDMKPQIFLMTPDCFPNYCNAILLAGGEITQDEVAAQGLLLPGGGDMDPALYGGEDTGLCRDVDQIRDNAELALCRRFLEDGRPILGICRGAQVLAVALGGTLLQDVSCHGPLPGGADSVHDTRTAGILSDLYGPECTVNSCHHQAVDHLPDCCRILQVSSDGVIEAFAHRCLPFLGIQWHPERLCGRFSRPDAVGGLPLLRFFLTLGQVTP